MNFYGYVTSREFGGLKIPVPAQNTCLREYVANRGGVYVLPPLESYYSNCYHHRIGLFRSIEVGSTLLMYSVLMLPVGKPKFEAICEIAVKKKARLSTVLENIENEPFEKAADYFRDYNLKFLASDYDTIKHYFSKNSWRGS